VDLGIAYSLKNVTPQNKNLKLQFNVFNLTNSGKVTSISTGSTVAQDTYIYQAPRSMMVSLKADF
jgi:iron complex outermembrane receptor protein